VNSDEASNHFFFYGTIRIKEATAAAVAAKHGLHVSYSGGGEREIAADEPSLASLDSIVKTVEEKLSFQRTWKSRKLNSCHSARQHKRSSSSTYGTVWFLTMKTLRNSLTLLFQVVSNNIYLSIFGQIKRET
jgi:hypothetical protein